MAQAGGFTPEASGTVRNRAVMRVQIPLLDDPEIYNWLKKLSEEFGISMAEVARQALKFAMRAE